MAPSADSIKNQRGAVPLFILIAVVSIVAFLAVTSTLPFKDQLFSKLFPKDSSYAGTKSPLENIYNPHLDSWDMKRTTNPFIPVGLTPGCFRNGPKASLTTAPTDELEFLNKSNAPLLIEECAIISDAASAGSLAPAKRELVRDYAEKLPENLKYIGYYSFYDSDFRQAGYSEIHSKAAAGDQAFEQFYVHKADGSRLTWKDNAGRFVLDITNPAYRDFITTKVANAVNDLKMDGVLSDLVYEVPLDSQINIADMPPATRSNWRTAQLELHQLLKQRLGDKILIVNVSRDNDFYKNLVDGRADGIMLEDPIGKAVGGAPSFNSSNPEYNKLKNILAYMRQVNKYAVVVVNTSINGNPSDPNNPITYDAGGEGRQRNYADYYLGVFLNMFRPNDDGTSKQVLMYQTPVNYPGGHAFNSNNFYKDWDIDLGRATSESIQLEDPGIYYRTFERGWVYVNTKDSNVTLPRTGGGLFNKAGAEINSGVVMPPKSGMIFMTREVLDSYNKLINLSISASCIGDKPAITLSFNDIGLLYTIETAPNTPTIKGIGVNGGSIPGRLTLRPLQIYDKAIDGIWALSPNTTYSLFIKSSDGTVTSNTATATTPVCAPTVSSSDAPPPPMPDSGSVPNVIPAKTLAYCVGTTSRNHVEWQSVFGASGYKVYRFDANGNNGIKLGETTAVGWNDEGVSPGTQYKYGIEAIVGSGIGGAQYPMTAVNCGTVAPGSFTLTSVQPYCSGTNSMIKLDYTASPAGPNPYTNSGYFVYLNGAYKYNNLHKLSLIDPEPKTYGQTYNYKIEAVMIPGGRTFSNEVSVAAANCTPPPGVFTLNQPETFCSGTNSHIKLSWVAAPNGPQPGTNSGYFVYVNGAYKYNNLHNLELTDPEPKTYGQVYKYKIEAVTIPGGRTFSNEQSVVARNCAPVPTPTPTPAPTATPTPTATPFSSPATQTVTFDDLTVTANTTRALNGQYPTNLINWGSAKWLLSAPWKKFTTNSFTFASTIKSANIVLPTPKIIDSIEVYNGGTSSTAVTIQCSGSTTKSQSVPADTIAVITTSWTRTCTMPVISSTNGSLTRFDNIKLR